MKTRYITTSAVIAALYAGLTYLSAFLGLAYGPVQLRFSEALCILPVFSPCAVAGLTVGCFLANLMSYNLIDLIFGTFATLTAALLTYLFRKIKTFNIPLLSFVCPVVVNALIVGAEVAFFFTEQNADLLGFVTCALGVALGETVACIGLGIPFYFAVKKHEKSLFKA